MEDVVSITAQTPVELHQCADDMRLHMFSELADVSSVRNTFSGCINNKTWRFLHHLKLNTDKTQLIWFGSRGMWTKLSSSLCHSRMVTSVILEWSRHRHPRRDDSRLWGFS
jgi:hypothetical protein